jgi:hypothetical protein
MLGISAEILGVEFGAFIEIDDEMRRRHDAPQMVHDLL